MADDFGSAPPGRDAVGYIPWIHPHCYQPPHLGKSAIRPGCRWTVRKWLNHPRVSIVSPGERHAEILFRLLTELGTAGNLASDAHLAALAIEYQAELVSATQISPGSPD